MMLIIYDFERLICLFYRDYFNKLTAISLPVNITLSIARLIINLVRLPIKVQNKNKVNQLIVLINKLKKTTVKILSYFWLVFNI